MNNDNNGFSQAVQTVNKTCTSVIEKEAVVFTPVELIPRAVVKGVTVDCCGEPLLIRVPNCCPSKCAFVVKQQLEMAVAIEYGADATAKNPMIDCTIYGNCGKTDQKNDTSVSM